MTLREAEAALDRARAERDAKVAELAAAGEPYSAIARRLGVSKARVGQYVAAHRARSKR